jgi:hypothetical protein
LSSSSVHGVQPKPRGGTKAQLTFEASVPRKLLLEVVVVDMGLLGERAVAISRSLLRAHAAATLDSLPKLINGRLPSLDHGLEVGVHIAGLYGGAAVATDLDLLVPLEEEEEEDRRLDVAVFAPKEGVMEAELVRIVHGGLLAADALRTVIATVP